MKVNLEKVSTLERRLSFEVPGEKVSEAFGRIYKKIQQEVTIKGFRKGKAPIQTIRSMYKDNVHRDVVEELVQTSYSQALVEKDLDPVNYPAIKIETSGITENEPFKFSAEFEVRPEIQLKQYSNLPVLKEKFSFNASDVEKVVSNILNSRADLVPVLEDRPAQKGDHAILDFVGKMNGQEIENAKGQGHNLELGSNEFIPGFEDGVEGMKVGQSRTINISFPAEYHAADLAGKPVSFEVTLKELKKKSLPTLDDKFAESVGFETVAKMRETIQKESETSEAKRIEEDLKNRILRVLVERNPLEVPKSMIKDQKSLLVEDVKNRMMGQGMSEPEFTEYAKKWDADFDKTATFIIRSSFLINSIAEKENLKATDEDLAKKVGEYAQQTGLELKRLEEFYHKPEQKSRLRFKVTEDKVVQFLLSTAVVKEVDKAELKD